jgi:hypothetical protein
MEREDSDLADCFNFYMAEQGFDQAIGLPDDEHRKVIQKQFDEFKAVMRDSIF